MEKFNIVILEIEGICGFEMEIVVLIIKFVIEIVVIVVILLKIIIINIEFIKYTIE